jgi:hypothetical protein
LLIICKLTIIDDDDEVIDDAYNETKFSTSYINNKQAYTVHEFSSIVASGYKIVEVPANIIYLPLNTRRISNLPVKLVDQDGNLINFKKHNNINMLIYNNNYKYFTKEVNTTNRSSSSVKPSTSTNKILSSNNQYDLSPNNKQFLKSLGIQLQQQQQQI